MRDHRNSVVGAYDASQDTVVGRAHYSANGRLMTFDTDPSTRATSDINAVDCQELGTYTGTGDPFVCDAPGGIPFAFNAMWRSPATGLVYMRNRVYSPRLGQFLSHDPLGYVDSYNLYQFAGFDPINRWDPYGLFAPAIPAGAAAGSFGALAIGVGSVAVGLGATYLREEVREVGRELASEMFDFAADKYANTIEDPDVRAAAKTVLGAKNLADVGRGLKKGAELLASSKKIDKPKIDTSKNADRNGGSASNKTPDGDGPNRKKTDTEKVEDEGLGESADEGKLRKEAEDARDALMKEKGRKHATYTAGHTKDGRVAAGCSSNPRGCAEDDVSRQLGTTDITFVKAKGIRNKGPGNPAKEIREIPICMNCQSKYKAEQFPDDVKSDPGGVWNE